MRLDLPFRDSEAIASGQVTARQLRGPGFRPLSRGIHVAADAPDDIDQRVRAALLRHPHGVVVGTTAARLYGVVDAAVSRDEPVELALGRSVRPAAGLLVRGDRLDAQEIDLLDGVPITTPLRTAFDVSRRVGTIDAVVIVEALARCYGVTVAQLRALAEEHTGERGLDRTRVALPHVQEDAAGALATRVRFALVGAGLPVAVTQPGTLDLAWPDLRCGLLCDRDDRTAWAMAGERLADGWSVQLVDPAEFGAHPERVIENAGYMVRRCRRAQRRPEDERDRIRATWPSCARRRTVTVRLYP